MYNQSSHIHVYVYIHVCMYVHDVVLCCFSLICLCISSYNIAGEEQVLSGKYSVTLGEWYILQMEAKVSNLYQWVVIS